MPVVDIPIDDSKFKKFSELFGEYQEKLAKTPGMWQKVDREFRRTTAAIMAMNQAMKESEMGSEGAANAAKSWRSIAGSARYVLGATFKITEKIVKWGALIGGGLLGGSLFGINRMAHDVATSRFGYMGLGMRYGGWRSFGINMSRFVDTGSFLSAINQAVSNPALQGPLYSLGVNPSGSTHDVSVAMLKAMRRLAVNTPRNELGMMSDAYGLAPFGGLETLLRLRGFTDRQFSAYMSQETRDRRGLALPPDVSRKWQDFSAQMERARSEIFKTFVVGLVPLEGPLSRLSQSLSGLVAKVMAGPEVKKEIDALAHWLDTFNGKMESKKFQRAVDTLVSDTGAIAGALHHIANAVRDVDKVYHWGTTPIKSPWANPAKLGSDARARLDAFFGRIARPAGVRFNNPGDLRFAGQPGAMLLENGFAAFRTSGQGLQALARQLELYGSRGNNTIGGIISRYAPPNENNTAAYVADMVKRMGVSASTPLNLNDPATLAKLMGAIIRHEQGYNPYGAKMIGRAALTATTPDSTITVTARHTSGASPVLASAQLAAGG